MHPTATPHSTASPEAAHHVAENHTATSAAPHHPPPPHSDEEMLKHHQLAQAHHDAFLLHSRTGDHEAASKALHEHLAAARSVGEMHDANVQHHHDLVMQHPDDKHHLDARNKALEAQQLHHDAEDKRFNEHMQVWSKPSEDEHWTTARQHDVHAREIRYQKYLHQTPEHQFHDLNAIHHNHIVHVLGSMAAHGDPHRKYVIDFITGSHLQGAQERYHHLTDISHKVHRILKTEPAVQEIFTALRGLPHSQLLNKFTGFLRRDIQNEHKHDPHADPHHVIAQQVALANEEIQLLVHVARDYAPLQKAHEFAVLYKGTQDDVVAYTRQHLDAQRLDKNAPAHSPAQLHKICFEWCLIFRLLYYYMYVESHKEIAQHHAHQHGQASTIIQPGRTRAVHALHPGPVSNASAGSSGAAHAHTAHDAKA